MSSFLEARPGSERNYSILYKYLASRDRFGVVGNANKKIVKDCYVLPLAGTGVVPSILRDLEADLPEGRSDSLLCMIVRTKRDREGATFMAGSMTPVAAAAVPVASTSRPKATVVATLPYKPVQYRPTPPAQLGSQIKTTLRPPAAVPPVLSSLEDEEPYEPEDEEPYSPGNSPPTSYSGQAAGYTSRSGPAGGNSPPLIR